MICSVKFIRVYYFLWFCRFEGVMKVHYDRETVKVEKIEDIRKTWKQSKTVLNRF